MAATLISPCVLRRGARVLKVLSGWPYSGHEGGRGRGVQPARWCGARVGKQNESTALAAALAGGR
jgi:hypothetical protein